jgi:hypothetical protein
VPTLLEHGQLSRFSRDHGDLTPLLQQNFLFDRTSGQWHLPESWTPLAELPSDELVRYWVSRLLATTERSGRAPTETQVQRAIQERFQNGRRANRQTIQRALAAVGFCADVRHWRLFGRGAPQHEFAFAAPDE